MMKNLVILLFVSMNAWIVAQDVHELARTGTVEQMKACLDKDSMALNRLSDRGITPFILACYRGNNEVAKYLITQGADVTYCAAEGSAIYGMIFKDNVEMLDYILALGYSPNDTCQFEQFGTPLHMAMSLKRYEIVRSLLRYKANTSIPDQQGRSLRELLKFYKDEQLSQQFKPYEKE
ncbi:MAG: ankyrin repeat domain-containing protein [Bacteroidetes bacterium]|nr:ankyrin repeat domain-containing protein [Bacteroidota bacterium]MBM3424795.1 ankyrin repeat domain-containing protein [Bacteroidota bacterium]